jgi:hypothetical protein
MVGMLWEGGGEFEELRDGGEVEVCCSRWKNVMLRKWRLRVS